MTTAASTSNRATGHGNNPSSTTDDTTASTTTHTTATATQDKNPDSTVTASSPDITPSSPSLSTTTTEAAAAPTAASSDTKTNGAGPPKKPAKRVRIPIACVTCRHKKIKCDGQKPCSHCEKFRAECVYPVATKPANQEYVETLENRLKFVETHLRGLLSSTKPGGAGAGTGANVGWVDPQTSLGDLNTLMSQVANQHSPQEELQQQQQHPGMDQAFPADLAWDDPDADASSESSFAPSFRGLYLDGTLAHSGAGLSTQSLHHVISPAQGHVPRLHNHPHHHSPPAWVRPLSISSILASPLASTQNSLHEFQAAVTVEDETEEEEDSAQPADESIIILEKLMGHFSVEKDGRAAYLAQVFGPKEESFLGARTYRDESASAALAEFSNELDWETLDRPAPYTPLVEILPTRSLAVLLDVYFNSVHTFLPLLHKSSFMTLCPSPSQQGQEHGRDDPSLSAPPSSSSYRVPPFLLLAMCAVAARHVPEGDLNEMMMPSQETASHHTLFDHARSLLDMFMDTPRLSTVQGLLLLAYYQLKEKRSGHFFRARMYLGMASRMAIDMELPLSLTSTESVREATDSKTRNATNSSSSTMVLTDRQTVAHQEQRLAWLGCNFLDGLMSGLLGKEYTVQDGGMDIPALVNEACMTTDTAHGAALIFWYHHLDLVQIYRKVCELYRPLVRSKSQKQKGLSRKHLEAVRVIEQALEQWLMTLPVHLAHTPMDPTKASAGDSGPKATAAADEDALPSYYTLYLHRFYYSILLLLHRPWMDSLAHRGHLDNALSPLSKCAHAASMLTQLGSNIFYNYSWPWPGCGMFAYQMIQAMEMHVFLMVTQSTVDAQSRYYRTMDLLKGYVNLVNMPGLQQDVLQVEQAVGNYILDPSTIGVDSIMTLTTLSAPVLPSVQQQQQQQQQTSSPLFEDTKMLSPPPPSIPSTTPTVRNSTPIAPSSTSMGAHRGGNHSGTTSFVRTFPPHQSHAHQNLPSATTMSMADNIQMAFAMPAMLTAAGMTPATAAAAAQMTLYGPEQLAAGQDLDVYGASYLQGYEHEQQRQMQQQQPQGDHSMQYLRQQQYQHRHRYGQHQEQDIHHHHHNHHHGLVSLEDLELAEDPRRHPHDHFQQQQQRHSYPQYHQQQQQQPSPPQHAQNAQHDHHHHHHVAIHSTGSVPSEQQLQQQPIQHLMSPPPAPASSTPGVSKNSISIMAPPTTPSHVHPNFTATTAADMAPSCSNSSSPTSSSPFSNSLFFNKTPKRILHQYTGSTNSSDRSASQRPPVPKKPSRLSVMGKSMGIHLGGGGGSSHGKSKANHAPSSPSSSVVEGGGGGLGLLPIMHVARSQSSAAAAAAAVREQQQSSSSSSSSSSAAAVVAKGRRPIKALPPQKALYGAGTMLRPSSSSSAANSPIMTGAGLGFGRPDLQHIHGLEYVNCTSAIPPEPKPDARPSPSDVTHLLPESSLQPIKSEPEASLNSILTTELMMTLPTMMNGFGSGFSDLETNSVAGTADNHAGDMGAMEGGGEDVEEKDHPCKDEEDEQETYHSLVASLACSTPFAPCFSTALQVAPFLDHASSSSLVGPREEVLESPSLDGLDITSAADRARESVAVKEEEEEEEEELYLIGLEDL